jgi:hypothetical protein
VASDYVVDMVQWLETTFLFIKFLPEAVREGVAPSSSANDRLH